MRIVNKQLSAQLFSVDLDPAAYIYNPVMFHFAGTVLNNTQLEQVYYIYLTLHFIS